jgi:N-acetylneuraminic acid mutarotase
LGLFRCWFVCCFSFVLEIEKNKKKIEKIIKNYFKKKKKKKSGFRLLKGLFEEDPRDKPDKMDIYIKVRQ